MLKPAPQGYVDGIDDPGMGWARYAQTIRIFVLNSGLFYIQPSERTVRHVHACARTSASELSAWQLSLMDRITGYLKTVKAWDQTVRASAARACSLPTGALHDACWHCDPRCSTR